MESQVWAIVGVFALGVLTGSKLQSEATKWKDDFLPWNAAGKRVPSSEHESSVYATDRGLVEKEQRIDD